VSRTESAATNNQDPGSQQAPLPVFADSIEENLSAVTIVHCV